MTLRFVHSTYSKRCAILMRVLFDCGTVIIATAINTACSEPQQQISLQSVPPDVSPVGVTRGLHRSFPMGQPLKQVASIPLQLGTVPYRIAASAKELFVVDTSGAILALDGRGRSLWKSEEPMGLQRAAFRNVRDMKVGPNGHLVVLDPNGTVTSFTKTGEVERTIQLHALTPAEGIIPVDVGRMFIYAPGAPAPLMKIMPTSNVDVPFPWPGIAAVPALAAQAVISQPDRDGYWVLGFAYGDGWFVFDKNGRGRVTGGFVEHTDFPPVIKTSVPGGMYSFHLSPAVESALAITLANRRVMVLFGGTSALAYRLVDVYDTETGAYLFSVTLPRPAMSLASGGDMLYALTRDANPQILVFSMNFLSVPRPSGERSQ